MTTYYVSCNNGDDSKDGLTPKTAKRTINNVPDDATAILIDTSERKETSELKPCPFCGEIPIVNGVGIEEWASCNTPACCANGDSFLLWDWNTRPIEDMMEVKIEKAIIELKRMAYNGCETDAAIALDIIAILEER